MNLASVEMTSDDEMSDTDFSIASAIVQKLHLVDFDQLSLATPDAERFSRLNFDDAPPCTTDSSKSDSQEHTPAPERPIRPAGVCVTNGPVLVPESPSKVLERALRTVASQISLQPPCDVALEGLAFFATQALASFSPDTDWVDTLFQVSSVIKARRDLRRAPVSVGDVPNPELGKNRGKSLKRRASETALHVAAREVEHKAPAVVLSTPARRKLMRALPKHVRVSEATLKELKCKRLAQRSADDLQLVGPSHGFSKRQPSNLPPAPKPPPFTGPSSLKRNVPSDPRGFVNASKGTGVEQRKRPHKRLKS